MNGTWWKRFRPVNLLIIAITQLFFVYLVLVPNLRGNIFSSKLEVDTFIIIFFTICAAAGGYVMNDIEDIDIDHINKPERAISNVQKWEWVNRFIFVLGFLSSLLVSFRQTSVWYVALYLIVWFFLFAYSVKLKCVPLVGNVLISVLSALVVLVVMGPFLKYFLGLNVEYQQLIIRPLIFYFIFAFLVSLIREIVKDLEDYEGDKLLSCRTLTVAIGDEKAKIFVLFFSGIFIATLITWIAYYSTEIPNFIIFYLAAVVVFPMLFLIYKVHLIKGSRSEKKQEYHKVSSWLKYIMLAGILALAMEFFFV